MNASFHRFRIGGDELEDLDTEVSITTQRSSCKACNDRQALLEPKMGYFMIRRNSDSTS